MAFADPVSSTSLISPKQFREFSLPALKNVDKIKGKNGVVSKYTYVEQVKEIWEDVVSTGISNFSIDNVEDLEKAKEDNGR